MLWETSEIILVDVVGMELSSCCLVNLEDMETSVVVISCFALWGVCSFKNICKVMSKSKLKGH
jgi:hypothetical protein